jgi:hypothetical protein
MRSSISSSDEFRSDGSRSFVTAFIVTLTACVLVAGAGTEMLIRTVVEPIHTFHRYLDLFSAVDSPDAVFGDSRAAYGFSAAPPFVNLAYPGDGPAGMRQKVKAYLERVAPDRVILQANPNHFSRLYRGRPETPMFDRLLENPDTPRLRILSHPHAQGLFGYWRAWIAGDGFKPEHTLLADGSRRVEGSKIAGVAEADQHRAARTEARAGQPAADPTSTSAFAVLEETARLAADAGAEVCVLMFPVSPAMADVLADMPVYDAATAAFRSLAASVGGVFVDGRTFIAEDALFNDHIHLNTKGAVRFAARAVEACYG